MRLDALDLLSDFLVLEVPQSLHLTLKPVFLAKLPLEAMVARVVAIDRDLFPASVVDGGKSMGQMGVFQLYLIPLIERHIPVVLLVGDVRDGLVHGGVEPVCYFGPGEGDVVVVMCLILEVHEELRLLCGHCMSA